MADGSVVLDTKIDESGLEKGLSKLGGAVKTGITTAVTAATAAITGATAAVVHYGSAFEQAFANTSTIFGDVNVDMEGLKSKILDLSNSSGIAATDLTNSLYNALSAGVDVTEDMSEAMAFLESSTKLAAAGFTSVDSAVDVTTSVLNAYQMDLSEADKVQKLFLQTQNKGKTTVDELAASLSQVTPTAAAMNVEFEQVSAALATMTAQGTPTAQSTTQLNSLFSELGKSSQQAAKNLALATEGTEYAGMNFSEMMEAGVPLNEVLGLMADYAEANGLSLVDMFGSLEAGKAALSLTVAEGEQYVENLEAMRTEADLVGDAYEKVTDTLQHSTDVLKQGMSNLGIMIYGELEGSLKDAADLAGGWVQEITDAFSEGGLSGAVKSLGNVLAEAVDYVTELAPKVIDAGMQLVSGLVQGLAKAAPSIAESATGMIDTLCDSLLKLSADLVTLGGELIVALCDGLSANIGNILSVIADGLVRLTTVIINTLPKLVEAGASLVTSLVQGLMEAVPQLLEAVPDLFSAFMEAMLSSATMIWQAVAQIVQQIAEQLPGMVQMLVDMLPGMIETYVSALMELLPVIVEAVTSMITALAEALPELVTILVEALPGVLDTIIAALVELAPALIEVVMTIIMALVEALPDIINQIIVVLPTLINSVIGALLELLPLLVDCGVQLFVALVQALPDIIAGIVSVLPTLIAAIVSTLVGMIPQLIECGIELLTSLVAALPQIIVAIVAVLPTIIMAVISALLDNIPLIVQCGIDLLTSLIQALPQIISAIVMAIPTIVVSIVNAFISNVGQIAAAGVQLLGSLITNLPSIIATLIKAVPQIVKSLVSSFTGLIPQMIEAGKNLLLGLGQGIANAVGSVISRALEVGRKIVNSVKSFFGINSPSKLFRDTIGANLVAGLAEGLTDNAKEAMTAAEDLASDLAGVSFTMQDPQMNVAPPKVDFDPDDYDYSGLLARVRGAVAMETAAAGAAVSAGRAAELYRGSGQGSDTTGLENGSSRPKTVYAEVKLDGKTVARQIGPYMEKELEWRDKGL